MTSPNSKQPLRAIIWCAVSTPEQAADDKESLPAQKRNLTSICETNGWRIVDTIEVPGFSRRYLDLDDFAEDLSRQPLGDEHCSAGFRLKDHLARRDFDVFVVRDGDRFGRSQSLFSRVAEDILFVQGKYIYAQHGGGLISADNGGREWITMQSYRASKEIDDLVRKRALGMKKRAERGILVSPVSPLSHRIVRDEMGRPLRTEVREDLRRLWDDLAQAILEGVSWWDMENVLYHRYGHVRPDGKRFSHAFFYRLVYNPVFWGHNPIGMFRDGRNRKTYGNWAFDDDCQPPDGITIHRHSFPSVWTGELAERVQSELRRRREIISGSARPSGGYAFSGLIVCAACGRRMTAQTITGNIYYRCNTSARATQNGWPPCSGPRRYLRSKDVQTFLSPLLERMISTGSIDLFALQDEAQPVDISGLAREIASLEAELERLILDKVRSRTPEIYERLIDQSEERLLILRARKSEVELRQQQSRRIQQAQHAALDEIAELSVERFWEQETRLINQTLRRLLGEQVLIASDGAIVATGISSRNRRSL